MGNHGPTSKLGALCGTDYFQKMKEKYGDDAAKFIVVQKCKELVNTKFSDVGQKISGLVTETQNKTTALAQQKSKEVKAAFQQMKQQINQAVPHGVEKLQSSRGQQLEQMIDLNKYINQIVAFKEQVLGQIQSQKNRINDDLRLKHRSLIDNIQNQCPNIPIFYDMPQSAQSQVMKKGETQFSAQIESKKESIYRQIDQQINIDSIRQNLASLVPEDQFNQLANSPKELFSSETGITKQVIQRLRSM